MSTKLEVLCLAKKRVSRFLDFQQDSGSQVSPGKMMLLQMYAFIIILFDVCVLLFRLICSVVEAVWRCFVSAPKRSVEGEIVLITGAGHGIGREIAYTYAKYGAKVICTDLNLETATETATEIRQNGGQAWAYRCDVSDRHSVETTADVVKRSIGNVTIVVNNAGIMPCHPFLSWSVKQIEQCIDINVKGCLWVTREFLPGMLEEKRGHVVSMSSVAGLVGCTNLVPYCASKHAVLGMMEALREEIRQDSRKFDVKFTTVCPFVVDTGLCKKPRVRFPMFMPIVSPATAAEAVVSAQRSGERIVCIPGRFYYLWKFTKVLPDTVSELMNDFFKTGLEPHDE